MSHFCYYKLVSNPRVAISWSGGKDAMMALHQVKESTDYEIHHLHTVIGESTQRVGMHGIHKSLIQKQADSLGIPVIFSELPADESHNSYEKVMEAYCKKCIQNGISAIVFGDIFLEDLKKYREKQLASTGLKALFPLWKNDTTEQLHDFLSLGYQTKICAGNAQYFNKAQVGQTLSADLIKQLTIHVDPCGENGEFHTFVYGGPLFSKPINVVLKEVQSHFYQYKIENEAGEIEEVKSEFYFADLV
ncbi:ATP-binding protein [Marivirga lumbricoides]|uniref:ATP-binding protein n=1 Tax=Marivirga lumbricoides TaxID=1046115 RepID=A0A2T4DR64_9BACT|nr:ATP-binding protein [Marivirga lumbricoides]